MNTKRQLLGCSLIAAITLAVLPYPSLATKNNAVPVKAQDEPVVMGQLVQNQTPDEELSKYFRQIRPDPDGPGRSRSPGSQWTEELCSSRRSETSICRWRLTICALTDYSAQVIDAAGVPHPLPKGEVITYKGRIKGLPDAQARMSLTEKGLEGAIITKQGRYFLQPARSISKQARPDEFILYESSDLTEEGGTCGVTLAEEIAAQEEMAKVAATDVVEAEANGPVSSISPMKIARISTDADGEYVASLGGATQANNQIESILNFVDGIYESEIGISFQIVQQNTWADANSDPYTSTSASTRLQEFRNHWNANFPNSGANRRAIAHLFTGVNLDGSTIGIASFGVACRTPNFSYGLSQQFPFGSTGITAQTVVLTAHEIGHNFGASHTNQVANDVPPDIERTCEETIMEASVGAGSSFCPFSRSQIAGLATGHSSCLDSTVTPPPTSQDCATTPLPPGGFVIGTLAPSDCRSPSRGVEHFADRYSFNGTAGQRVFITMGQGTAAIDPYLYLIAPDGYFLAQDDDGNGGVSSRIPTGTSSGAITLPQTGVYILEATSFSRQQTGTYDITLSDTSCNISASPGSFHFPSGGGNSSINVTLTGCVNDNTYRVAVEPFTASWVVPEISNAQNAVGSRSISFNVSGNSGSAGRRAFIMVGAASSDFTGGLRIPITQSGTGPDCGNTPINFGQTLNGTLANEDCHSPVRGNGFVADRYTFSASAGQRVTISTNAPVGNPDTFLTLLGPNGVVLLTDDDSGGDTNSRIPGGNRPLTLGLAGTYTIEVTPFDTSGRGSYSVTLTTDNPGSNSVQFSQTSFTVNETQPTVTVTVNRSGDVSGPATVELRDDRQL